MYMLRHLSSTPGRCSQAAAGAAQEPAVPPESCSDHTRNTALLWAPRTDTNEWQQAQQSHEDGWGLEHFLWGKAEGMRLVQPVQEMALGRPKSSLPIPMVRLSKWLSQGTQCAWRLRTRTTEINLNERFMDIRKNIFTMGQAVEQVMPMPTFETPTG